MNRPMRVYGLNVFEVYLCTLLNALGWITIAVGVVGVFWRWLLPSDWLALGIATVFVGLVLLLAAGGIRQNRAALDLGLLTLVPIAVGWVLAGVLPPRWPPLVIGVLMAAGLLFCRAIRHRGVEARFNPRFFSQREFETMVQVVDILIRGEQRAVLSPIEIAIQSDHALAQMSSPRRAEFKKVLFLTEWFLPLLMSGRPFPFSDLGSNERRAVLERLVLVHGFFHKITAGQFRSVARALKMLACVGYYGTEPGMESVHYVPFEKRPRAASLNTANHVYPIPRRREDRP